MSFEASANAEFSRQQHAEEEAKTIDFTSNQASASQRR